MTKQAKHKVCPKCQGCLDWTSELAGYEHSYYRRIPCVRCINCGSYWYDGPTDQELIGNHLHPEEVRLFTQESRRVISRLDRNSLRRFIKVIEIEASVDESGEFNASSIRALERELDSYME